MHYTFTPGEFIVTTPTLSTILKLACFFSVAVAIIRLWTATKISLINASRVKVQSAIHA